MKNFLKKLAGLDDKKIDVNDANENNSLERLNQEEETNEWIDDDYEEGQLSIDIYQTPKNIIVKSTIAGVKPEDIDISINNDMLTIRGKREDKDEVEEDNYLYRECYWGSFSRSVILPVEVKADQIEAVLENGVLSVILPKAKTSKQISVKVKEK